MGKNYFHRVHEQTPTRFWINNVTREQAELALNEGAVGCTQNPSYTWKMMTNEKERPHVEQFLSDIIKQESDDSETLVMLQRELVSEIAKYFMPLYEKSGHRLGYVSIQGDPFHEDTETLVRHAKYNVSASPNLMAKIPATADGLKAIRILLAEGIPINATEVMAVRQALDVCEIYNEVCAGMPNPPVVYFSHITGIYDEYLQKTVEQQKIDVSRDYLWHAGIAIARKTYDIAKQISPAVGFIGGGARGLHHFTEMVGADAVITINWEGTADKLIEQNPIVCQRFFTPTPHRIIDELCEKVPDFEKGFFINSITPDEYEEFGPVVMFRTSFEIAWKKAIDYIAQKREEISEKGTIS